jgi:hypothetical protein
MVGSSLFHEDIWQLSLTPNHYAVRIKFDEGTHSSTAFFSTIDVLKDTIDYIEGKDGFRTKLYRELPADWKSKIDPEKMSRILFELENSNSIEIKFLHLGALAKFYCRSEKAFAKEDGLVVIDEESIPFLYKRGMAKAIFDGMKYGAVPTIPSETQIDENIEKVQQLYGFYKKIPKGALIVTREQDSPRYELEIARKTHDKLLWTYYCMHSNAFGYTFTGNDHRILTTDKHISIVKNEENLGEDNMYSELSVEFGFPFALNGDSIFVSESVKANLWSEVVDMVNKSKVVSATNYPGIIPKYMIQPQGHMWMPKNKEFLEVASTYLDM